MDFTSVLQLLGGLAFFLYGMNVMSSGLEKMVGGRLEKVLASLTNNPVKSMLLGAGLTVAIQSSSATTVILVGLVNSGLMQFGQTIGVTMGANVGTTLTAWLFSFIGVESDNFFLTMLKPTSFAPVVALIGAVLITMFKSPKKKDIGSVCLGFAILMTGMSMMSDAVSPLAEDPNFSSVLTMFRNPLLAVVAAAVFTGIIQSSAAGVGILQALSVTGALSYQAAIPLVMGLNIGTCMTALLSSIGTNKNAKRVAWVHVYIKIIGTVVCLVGYFGLNAIFRFSFTDQAVTPVSIALIHTLFNVINTVILFPFIKQLERLTYFLIRDTKEEPPVISLRDITFLDERLMKSPAVALGQCRTLTNQMAELAKDTMKMAFDQMSLYEPEIGALIEENENLLDTYEDKLGTFLVTLSSKALSDADSHEASLLSNSISDFERIGDHATNILGIVEKMDGENIRFSSQASGELSVLCAALEQILNITIESFVTGNVKLAMEVEPLEQVIDDLQEEIQDRHIQRLNAGLCDINSGLLLNDFLGDCERVSDHCSNLAVRVIRAPAGAMDSHAYLGDVKGGKSSDYEAIYSRYAEQYNLAAAE